MMSWLPARSGLELLLWIALVLMVVACSRESSPEAEVRALLARAQTAAAERDVRTLRGLIADDYADALGHDLALLHWGFGPGVFRRVKGDEA